MGGGAVVGAARRRHLAPVIGGREHPGVLGAAALAGVHDQAASGSATRVSPPGTTHTSRPSFTANGRRSRWRAPIRPSTNVGAVDSATGSWAIQPRGSASTFARRSASVASLATGPMTMPLPPEPSTGLNTSASMRAERPLAHFGVLEPVRLDVGEDRHLAEVVLDHRRHVRVDRLVVGDAVAGRVRDGHVAGSCGVEDARAPEHRLGAEVHRVEEVVVDPPVDDVDPLLAAGRAHVDPLVATHEVATLDQLDAHLAGEERVLEVRGVVDAGREHDDARVVDARRRGGAERLEQPLRVVGDPADAVAGEQLGEHVRHRPPVLDHVRDPRRRAQVVLQHPEAPGPVAHEVDAGDVDAHAARGVESRRRTGGSATSWRPAGGARPRRRGSRPGP